MGTRRGLLFGWLGMLMFSGTVVATRFAVRELDPTFIALGRALVAVMGLWGMTLLLMCPPEAADACFAALDPFIKSVTFL